MKDLLKFALVSLILIVSSVGYAQSNLEVKKKRVKKAECKSDYQINDCNGRKKCSSISLTIDFTTMVKMDHVAVSFRFDEEVFHRKLKFICEGDECFLVDEERKFQLNRNKAVLDYQFPIRKERFEDLTIKIL